MTEAVEKRAIAFIRTIGNRCMSCLHRSEERCRNCISSWANSILRDYDSETTPQPDYSLSARMVMIADALDKAGRPLFASEIDLKNLCTKQLKRWTLQKMMRLGFVRRSKTCCTAHLYRYSLVRSKPFPVSAGQSKK
ncbi:MAG: hypothetical protein II649_12150 [Kiritimatiellae bacterium]|nr:hypothetical protein [Kiritimatiellia bacterium]